MPVLLVPLVLYAGWTTLARRGVREALVVFPIALTAGALVGAPLFGSVYAFFQIAYFAVAAALTAVGLRLRRPTHVVLVGVALAPALVVLALAPLLLLPLTHGLDGARR